ncbi:MAG: septum formation initiator family protein [Betaproteobacteria bacterium]|nr:septum formation initiator family protein [Betaproteobacteria bacterium]MBU6513623.1 septum formation initiator family protein [Betaproteobacteria bacterium]MDE1955353.1 septum formation initiator family protein [Betaproteobacteria bacterium]MDE2153029.1 septum formation initiator family protein [Betaproteobacteria bacterium]
MRRLRWVTVVLLAALALMQWPLWLGERGWPAVHRLRAELRAQLQANERARQDNEALSARARDLRSGAQAVQGSARSEMGMMEPDEVFVQVLPASSPLPPVAAPSAPARKPRR